MQNNEMASKLKKNQYILVACLAVRKKHVCSSKINIIKPQKKISKNHVKNQLNSKTSRFSNACGTRNS